MRLPISPYSLILTYLTPFRSYGTFYVLLTPPYSTQILGVLPLHQIAHVGVSERMGLKLFGREIIYEEFQPM